MSERRYSHGSDPLRRGDLTIAEAEAWRVGFRARGALVCADLRIMAKKLRAQGCPSEAATLDTAADALARMEMPEPMREPPGTEYRG